MLEDEEYSHRGFKWNLLFANLLYADRPTAGQWHIAEKANR